MKIKQILASAALILPFAVTAIPSQASALEVIVNPHAHNASVQKIARKTVIKKVVRKKVFIPAHWEKTSRGRRWVPARYVYR